MENSADSDQMPQDAASDPDLYWLQAMQHEILNALKY